MVESWYQGMRVETKLLDVVGTELELVEAKLRSGGDAMFEPLGEALFALLDSGGKRVRPALVLLAGRFGCVPIERDRVPRRGRRPSTPLPWCTTTWSTTLPGAVGTRRSMRPGRAPRPCSPATTSCRAVLRRPDREHPRREDLLPDPHDHLRRRAAAAFRRLRSAARPGEAYYARNFAKTASLFAEAIYRSGAVLNGCAGAARGRAAVWPLPGHVVPDRG